MSEYYRLYGFWVVLGLVVVLAIASYFVATAPIQEKIVGTQDLLEKTSKDIGPYARKKIPNNKNIERVTAEQKDVSAEVNELRRRQREPQARASIWMKPVHARIQTPTPKSLDVTVRSIFASSFWPELGRLYRESGAMGEHNPEGKFRMYEGVLEPPGWARDWAAAEEPEDRVVPTEQECRRAQENLWIYRTLMKIINEANADAKGFHDAVVKQVDLIEIGTDAAADDHLWRTVLHKGTQDQDRGVRRVRRGQDARGAGRDPGETNQRYLLENDDHLVVPIRVKVMADPLKLSKLFLAIHDVQSKHAFWLETVQFSLNRSPGIPLPGFEEDAGRDRGSDPRMIGRPRDGQPAKPDAWHGPAPRPGAWRAPAPAPAPRPGVRQPRGPERPPEGRVFGEGEGEGEGEDGDEDEERDTHTAPLWEVDLHLRLYLFKIHKKDWDFFQEKWEQAEGDR